MQFIILSGYVYPIRLFTNCVGFTTPYFYKLLAKSILIPLITHTTDTMQQHFKSRAHQHDKSQYPNLKSRRPPCRTYRTSSLSFLLKEASRNGSQSFSITALRLTNIPLLAFENGFACITRTKTQS